MRTMLRCPEQQVLYKNLRIQIDGRVSFIQYSGLWIIELFNNVTAKVINNVVECIENLSFSNNRCLDRLLN